MAKDPKARTSDDQAQAAVDGGPSPLDDIAARLAAHIEGLEQVVEDLGEHDKALLGLVTAVGKAVARLETIVNTKGPLEPPAKPAQAQAQAAASKPGQQFHPQAGQPARKKNTLTDEQIRNLGRSNQWQESPSAEATIPDVTGSPPPSAPREDGSRRGSTSTSVGNTPGREPSEPQRADSTINAPEPR